MGKTLWVRHCASSLYINTITSVPHSIPGMSGVLLSANLKGDFDLAYGCQFAHPWSRMHVQWLE